MICIIDGYNVMHSIEEGAGIAAEELEAKRKDFVESVISQAAASGDETYIVFDSASARSPQQHQVEGTPVTVYFASTSESADIIIGKLVQQKLSATKEEIRVVSADWEVQKGAMMARVERMPPRHFLAEIKNFEKRVANSSQTDKIRWKLEHKVDLETLKKLEDLRRGRERG